MRSSEIRKAVYEGLAPVTKFADNTDRLIASCLVFDYVRRVVSRDTSTQNNAKQLVESYTDLFFETLSNFKRRFVSYNAMRDAVEGFGRDNFLAFTDQQIAQVVSLYQDRTLIAPFSTRTFSQYMYKVTRATKAQHDRLRRIHFDVMVPVIRFYMDNYGLRETDIEIESGTEYAPSPGKEILFSVKDVTASKVASDIRTGRIAVDVYSVDVSGSLVRLVNK